jgi:hypothetical protein
MAGERCGRGGLPAAVWRGSSSTDETARDEAASLERTTIHSEKARQQAIKAAATAAIRLFRR